MKASTKTAVERSSRATTLAAEAEGASSSERAKPGVEKRPRWRLASTIEGSAALSYAGTGFFFVAVFLLARCSALEFTLMYSVRPGLDNPTLPLQIMISLSHRLGCTQSFDSGAEAAPVSVWNEAGPLDVILLKPRSAESDLERGATSLPMPRLT